MARTLSYPQGTMNCVGGIAEWGLQTVCVRDGKHDAADAALFLRSDVVNAGGPNLLVDVRAADA